MSEIQIDYTSRDYEGLKADLISFISQKTGVDWTVSDPNDLGGILIESFAYMGDIMSYYLDRVANETSVDTAVKRANLLAFASLYGYKPTGPTPAVVRVSFTNLQDENTIDIPVGTQVMAVLSYGAFNQVYFETIESATAVLPGQTVQLLCIEGKTVNTDRPDLISPINNKPLPSAIGTSNGAANQEVLVIDIGIVDNSLVVYVGQGVAFATWNYVPSLVEAGPQSLVFTTRQEENGSLTVIFGDGINGAIPGNGQLISAQYRTSAGLAGNISANTISEVTFVPGNVDPEAVSYLQARNAAPAVGGADADNTTQLRAKIKASISTRQRAVTLSDYEYLSSLVSSVGKAKAEALVFNMVNLYVQQVDDATATPGIINNINDISDISGDGTYVTYTTAGTHLYSVGEIVSITGVTPSSYNLTDVVIYDTPTSNTFRVLDSTTDAYVSDGSVAGTQPSSSWQTISSAVSAYMADKIPVGSTLNVYPPVYVPINIVVAITAQDVYRASAVRLEVYKSLLGTNGLFTYDKNVFGRKIYMSNVITAASSAIGVSAVDLIQLNTTEDLTANNIFLKDNEVPYLLPENLIITVVGGVQ